MLTTDSVEDLGWPGALGVVQAPSRVRGRVARQAWCYSCFHTTAADGRVDSLNVIEVIPPHFHSLGLCETRVMLIEDIGRDVRPVAHNTDRHPFP